MGSISKLREASHRGSVSVVVWPLKHILLLLGWCAAVSLLGQDLNFERYGTEEGLPQTQVKTVFQDNEGYLWIGTLSGAARYNGQRWEVFTKETGLVKNDIKVIQQDPEGNILFGTVRGVSVFDGEKFSTLKGVPILVTAEIRDILVDKEGTVWFATSQGLVARKGDAYTIFTKDNDLPDLRCRAMYQRNNGTIWVATDGGVAWFDGHLLRPFVMRGADVLKEVNAFVEDENGRFYFATAKGLYIQGDSGFVPYEKEGVTFLQNYTGAVKDYFGTLYFTSSGNGVLKIEEGETFVITTRNGLAYNIVLCALVDRENNIWFGTDDGLNKLSEGPFQVYNVDHGLTDNFIRTIFVDGNNRIWFGSRNGVSVFWGGTFHYPVDTKKLPDPRVYSIGKHPDGRMLILTLGGLVAVRDDDYQVFQSEKELPIGEPKALHVEKNGKRIWIGGKGLATLEDGAFQPIVDPEIKDALILDIEEDERGHIWFGSRNAGLISFDTEEKVFTSYRDNFDVAIWSLDMDTAGNLWIGTNERGLFRYNGTAFTQYSIEEGLANPFIWQVLCTTSGDIWLGHNKGLDRMHGNKITHYSKSDGLADNEAAATAVVEDLNYNLWFGTGKGVTRFLPNRERSLGVPPLVHIEKVMVMPAGREVASGVVLERKSNSLEFHFAGLSYRDEKSLRYRFKLQGHDEDWSEPTAQTSRPYNNLRPSQYQFMVMAANNDGIWSEAATFPFVIKPAFYETWLFRSFAFMVILSCIGGWHRIKMKRIRVQNEVLEGLVLKRTEELAAKNEELRKLSLSDSLTKLRNRRYLTEIMPEEVQQLQRRFYDAAHQDHPDLSKAYLGFMMIDMDHFKKINDTYGHDAGDQVLVQLAYIFKDVLRSSDVVVRWGGEEFLVLLRDVKMGSLGQMAKRMLERVRGHKFSIGTNGPIRGTCSIGYAYYPGHVDIDKVTWEHIVKLADMALYNAKNEGRDRACGISFKTNLDDYLLHEKLNGNIQDGIDEGIFRYMTEGDF